MPCLVPGATRSFLVPCSVGTSTSAPRERLGDRDRHLDLEVVALGLEHRRLLDVGDHVQVAGRAAAQAGLALAGERMREPSCTPAGMLTR